MATIFRTAPLDIAPEIAWTRIAAVGKVHEILPAIATCELEGEHRVCTFESGGVLHERVIAVDAELMRVAYTITNSPFNFEHHSASMQIVPEADGARILWTTDVKPDSAKTEMAALFDQLLAQLAQRLAAP